MGRKSVDLSEEAYSRLKDVKTSRESLSETIMRISSDAQPRRNSIRRVCFVLWGYSFAIWLYVIAYQLSNNGDVYDPLAWWLPIRMDYLGEAAFVLSLIFALFAALQPFSQQSKGA